MQEVNAAVGALHNTMVDMTTEEWAKKFKSLYWENTRWYSGTNYLLSMLMAYLNTRWRNVPVMIEALNNNPGGDIRDFVEGFAEFVRAEEAHHEPSVVQDQETPVVHYGVETLVYM